MPHNFKHKHLPRKNVIFKVKRNLVRIIGKKVRFIEKKKKRKKKKNGGIR